VRRHFFLKTRCRAQPLLPWPADGLFAGEELGLLSRALLLQLVRPKSFVGRLADRCGASPAKQLDERRWAMTLPERKGPRPLMAPRAMAVPGDLRRHKWPRAPPPTPILWSAGLPSSRVPLLRFSQAWKEKEN
jgi:hypothetical protein